MNGKIKKLFKYVFSIALGIVLLYFAFKGVNWKEFFTALKNCNWYFVILSILCGVVAHIIRAQRWKRQLIMIDPTTRFVTTFNAVNICMMVNLVLPRIGEVVRCGYITKHSAKDKDGRRLSSPTKAFGTVISDRLWDVIMILLVMILLIIFGWKAYGKFFNEKIFSNLEGSVTWIYYLVGIIAFIALFVYLIWVYKEKNRFCRRIYGIVKGLFDGLSTLFKVKGVGYFLLDSLLLWICYWMTSATIVWAIQAIDPANVSPELAVALESVSKLNLLDALFLMFAGCVSSFIPVPGGFGAFHVIVSGALMSITGLPFEFAMIFSTLSHESQVMTEIICGTGSYIHESFRTDEPLTISAEA